jgi:hypothetical protein
MALTTEHERVGDPVLLSTRALPDISRFGRNFGVIAVMCMLFVVNTTIAMLLYPGGAVSTATSHSYQFFLNFFSDIGRSRTESGAMNYPSMPLFSSAMIAVGGGAAAFYLLLAAILLEIAAIRRTPGLPTALLWVNSAFVVVLLGYVALMTFGPTVNTLLGDKINVTAQKIIVYTAIATISTQAQSCSGRIGPARARRSGEA